MATDWIGKAHSYAARNFGGADPSHLVQAYLSGAIDCLAECRERDRSELQRLQAPALPPAAEPACAARGSSGDGAHRAFNPVAFRLVDEPHTEAA